MSHSIGAVLFIDGIVMYYEYNGTVDVCIPKLYTTEQECLENWRQFDWNREINNQIDICTKHSKPVEIMSTYGGGFSWSGKACREHGLITHNLSIDTDENDTNNINLSDGEPDWSPWKEQ